MAPDLPTDDRRRCICLGRFDARHRVRSFGKTRGNRASSKATANTDMIQVSLHLSP